MKNVIEYLISTTDKYPDRIALIQDDRKITFKDIYNDVLQTVKLFEQKGIVAGDQVLVFVPISIDLYRHVLALFYIGAIPVFLDEWVSIGRLKECMNCLDCKAIIAPQRFMLLTLFVKKLVAIPIKVLAKSQSKNRSQSPFFEASLSSPALITFTTGTTDIPKAAIRTHGNLVAQFSALSQYLDYSIEYSMSTLPIVVLINVGLGRTTVLPPKGFKIAKPKTILKLLAQIDKHKVESIIASPSVFKNLVCFSFEKNEQIKELISGGSSVFPSLAQEITEHFPVANAQVVFGGTEAEPISHIRMDALVGLNADYILDNGLPVGTITSESELCIVPFTEQVLKLSTKEELAGKQLNDYAVGEIIVSGPHVVAEYLNNDIAIAKSKISVSNTVWHRTGDVACRKGASELFYYGRGVHRFEINGKIFYPMLLEYYVQQKTMLFSFALFLKDGFVHAFVCKSEREKIPLIQSILGQQNLPNVQFHLLRTIPKDKRHQSKVDYDALMKRL